ncbi:MAG: hypothetical protein JNL63_13435 [Bacteroidia bacterium]|nr:hypothetical protein [Bacteroidia bacterium]
MDSREKIFFKAYSIRRRDNKGSHSYIKLFDVINTFKGKEYDTQLLKSRLKKAGFSNSLKKAKEHLTKAILKSLTEYHSDTSESIQMRALLDQAEILISKKIYKVAKKILLKTEKLARAYEKHGALIEICSLRSTIARETASQVELEYVTKEQIKYERRYSDYIRNIVEYKHLADKVHYLLNESDNKVQNSSGVREILNSPLLTSPKAALTHHAIRDYYNIHFQTSFFLQKGFDSKLAGRRQGDWIKYLESDKLKLFNRLSNEYLTALSNMMVIQSISREYQECEVLLNKADAFFNSLPSKRRTKVLELKIFVLTINYMVSQIKSGNPKKSIEAGEKIIAIATGENPNRIVLWDNLFSAYFLLEDYHEALKHLNEIINFKQKYRPDVQAMSRIYLLLTHYELGHLELLPYLAKQARHFFIKHECFSEFKKAMIQFFEKEIHIPEKKQERIIAFNKLKQRLETLFENPKYSAYLEYFNFISWLESKIENRPFVEILREKTLQKRNR